MAEFAKNKKKIIAVTAILLFVLTVYLLLKESGGALKAEAETAVCTHTVEVTGKLLSVPVSLGQEVQAGEILAKIDDSDANYALEQLKLTLVQKQAALRQLQEGTESQTLTGAAAAVKSAQAAYEKAERDCENQRLLYAEGAATENDYLNTQTQKELAAAALTEAQQQYSLLAQGSDDNLLVSAEAAVRQIESQIKQAQEKLAKYTVKASADGTVVSLNFSVGDLVSAGCDLAEVADSGQLYLVAYLPAEKVAKVNYGDSVKIIAAGGNYTGELIYIDLKSQYTPKDLQSAANKNKESFKIKVKVPAEADIKPGEQVKIKL
ncbi:MAG: HlyD family efflux transporter periplasmic adaptor subunit [Clostridia bacterium]|nr:HlyD family efflux transporter periplasmic adaptor subunit [Clostridia bacterium]